MNRSSTDTVLIGGASIVAATGYGAIVAGAGAGVNLVTDITDQITQRIEGGQIKTICTGRDNVAKRLEKHFTEINNVYVKLQNLNVKEDEALLLSMVNAVTKNPKVQTTAEELMNLKRCAQAASGASNLLLRNGGYFWKGMRLQSETLTKSLTYLGLNLGKTGAMAVVRTGTVLLNGALAIYDVYALIQTITNNHPTADAIAALVQKLREELGHMTQLREFANEIQK